MKNTVMLDAGNDWKGKFIIYQTPENGDYRALRHGDSGTSFTHLQGNDSIDYPIITILPALPKYPMAADMPDLYKYASEGLMVEGHIKDIHSLTWDGVVLPIITWLHSYKPPPASIIKITHATYKGERVEIARLEKEDEHNKI